MAKKEFVSEFCDSVSIDVRLSEAFPSFAKLLDKKTSKAYEDGYNGAIFNLALILGLPPKLLADTMEGLTCSSEAVGIGFEGLVAEMKLDERHKAANDDLEKLLRDILELFSAASRDGCIPHEVPIAKNVDALFDDLTDTKTVKTVLKSVRQALRKGSFDKTRPLVDEVIERIGVTLKFL